MPLSVCVGTLDAAIATVACHRIHLAALAAVFALACTRRAPGPSRAGDAPPPNSGSAAAEADIAGAPKAQAVTAEPEPMRAARAKLVAALVAAHRLRTPRIIDAMGAVRRDLFVPEALVAQAYDDHPLPIGSGQTISEPSVVAVMTEALEPRATDRVLEIGTGSGYQAAILGELVAKVYTIELLPELGVVARARLDRLGYSNIRVRIGDGYRGWPEEAPFDRIMVTAAPPTIPAALLDQLAEGGVLVAPVGERDELQRLVRVRRTGGRLLHEELGSVLFVPMVPGG